MAVRFDAAGENYTRALTTGAQASVSITCWAKLSADRNTTVVIWLTDNGTTNNALIIQTDGTGTAVVAGDSTVTTTPAIALTVGTWYFMGVSVNAGAGTFTVRALDAATWTTRTWTGGQATHDTDNLRLGNYITAISTTNWLNGCLAAVKVWIGTTLTAAELQSEAWSYRPMRSGTTAWYPLLRTETVDYSGNGHTLSGGTGATTEDGPGIGWGWRRSGLYAPIAVGVMHDLEAVGLASSSGTAVSLVGAVLAADGVATSSGSGSLLAAIPLTADGQSVSAATGALELAVALASSGLGSSSGVAAIQAEVGLSAAGVAASAGSGAIVASVALAGAAQAAVIGTGVLTATRELAATGAATSSGTAEAVVGFTFTGLASSSGAATLTLTITLGTAVGLATVTGDNEFGLEVLIGAVGRGSSTGRAVLYIALPWHPSQTGAPGRGPGGGVTGPTGRTQATGTDTGRTRG